MEALGDDERAAGGTKFGRDDRVIVMEGELKTLIGRVVEVKDDGSVRIMPLLEGLEELDLPARQLQKYFQARCNPPSSAALMLFRLFVLIMAFLEGPSAAIFACMPGAGILPGKPSPKSTCRQMLPLQ
jgi:hypothetical protein